MVTCSSILAGEIPWTEEPGWLQSTVTKSQMTEHTHRKLVLQGKLNLLSYKLILEYYHAHSFTHCVFAFALQ